ncbi:MAG: nodulation protein NfeD, partial [Calditrichota bacterium]
HRIRVQGIINPVTAEFMTDAVKRGEKQNAEAVVIELDTPGGLMEATRNIVQVFLASKVPVIVYVSPAGARAGSAGVFITLAAHIAVMAPGSNIGAAHPVTIGGGGMPGSEQDTSGRSVMTEKMTNDAAALIRSIAEQRHRNLEWAEKAVRESAAITATDALKLGVVDLLADDLDSLLQAVDGRTVKLAGGVERTLATAQAEVRTFEMTWQKQILDKISDPNIAYVLMMLGIYGLIFELSNPGAVLPGVIGGICLLLAFFAFQTLPLNAAGILLILFGIILLLLEIKVASYGVLTIGGAASLILGSVMLIDSPLPALRVSLGVIIPSVIFLVLFVLFAVGMAVRAQSRKVTTGAEGLVGEYGEALEDLNPQGKVFVAGEYWNAESNRAVGKGGRVRVVQVKGMLLIVEPE